MNEVGLKHRWRLWIIIAVLTVALHLLLLMARFQWHFPPFAPRVEIQKIDPRKLEAIRRQWKNKSEPKGLFIDKDKTRPNEKEAPPNARYMSDRNIRVDRETKARETTVLPKPGSAKREKQHNPPQPMPKPAPLLGRLGVPLNLTPNPKKVPRFDSTQTSSEEGGEQYIKDNDVPEGSQTLLNTQESVYYSFYARLYEAIGPLWRSRILETRPGRKVNPGEYSTSVDVALDEQGNLLRVTRLESSGIPEFDQVAETSWQKIGRFPNPPKGLLNGQGEVHTGWTFTVRVGQGVAFEYATPERTY